MERRLLKHIMRAEPSIDILGQWLTVGNAKTAQKSIMNGILADRHVKRSRGWRNYRRVWDHVILPRIDDIFMFTFVRNPWDRTVSAFHFLQQRHQLYRHYTFQGFLKKELAPHGTDINRHFWPQAKTFLYRGKPIPNMFIGRFERLHEDWAIVADKLGVQRELPHINKSTHKPYADYYDYECAEIVAKLYAEEIAALGYRCGNE